MTHEDYQKLIHLAYIKELPENSKQAEDILQNGFFIPATNMDSYLNELFEGEIRQFKAVTSRDLKLHRCYFSLLEYIYNYLPESFKNQVKSGVFYRWLQTLKGDYEVLFRFKDGRELLKYNSISFSKMDEHQFREHIKEQMPFIYDNVIMELFEEKTANVIIENIEKEYEKFFTKLFKTINDGTN